MNSTHLKRWACALTISTLLAASAQAEESVRIRTMVEEDVTTETLIRSLNSPDAQQGAEVSIAAPVTFEFDSAQLTRPARGLLDRIAAALNAPEFEGVRFVIEGHTDAKGSDQYNQSLSERRAAAVFNYLVSRGVGISNITAVGYGESRLLPDVSPIDGLNRRVEVVRLPEGQAEGGQDQQQGQNQDQQGQNQDQQGQNQNQGQQQQGQQQ